MLEEGDGVVGLVRDAARLLVRDGILERLRVGVVGLEEVGFVVAHVGEHVLVGFAGEEGLLEVFGCLGAAVFPTLTEMASVGVTDGGQEVGRGLARGRVEAEVDKVLSGFGCRALVQHAAFVDDEDLVHQLVDTLARLVQCGDGSTVADVGHNTEGAGIVEGCRSIKSAS